MLIDTHCHLNFEAFNGRVGEVIKAAKNVGVDNIIVPGTDIETSKKAIEIAEKYEGIYAAVGIHPHHVFEIYSESSIPEGEVSSLSKLLSNTKVVAVGEIGIDRHIYRKTKYPDYKIEKEFIELQKIFFIEQIKLAHKYKKTLIIHNREAKKDVLEILTTNYQLLTTHSSVFHCCEPDIELLEFAKKHKIFIGIDGDVTYQKDKQEFIKKVPLEMLVLETDSPFLMPRLLSGGRSSTRYNEPKNIPLIAEFVAKLKNVPVKKISEMTTENARMLFKVSPSKKV